MSNSLACAAKCICEQTTRLADNTDELIPTLLKLKPVPIVVTSPDETIDVTPAVSPITGAITYEVEVDPENTAQALVDNPTSLETLKEAIDTDTNTKIVDNGDGTYTVTHGDGTEITIEGGGDTQVIVERLEEELVYLRESSFTSSPNYTADTSTKHLVTKLQVPVDGVYIIRARARIDSNDGGISGSWLQVKIASTGDVIDGTAIENIPDFTALPSLTAGRDQDAYIAPSVGGVQSYNDQWYNKTENYTRRLSAGDWVYYTIRARGPGTFTINNPELILARTLSALS